MENMSIIMMGDNGSMKVKILYAIYKAGDYFIAIVPHLKLSARSTVSPEEAENRMDHIIKKFFSLYKGPERLDKELQRLGWENSEQPTNLPSELFDLKAQLNSKELELQPCE